MITKKNCRQDITELPCDDPKKLRLGETSPSINLAKTVKTEMSTPW
jgi:hypothetical protein